jgi:hypothetical protein
MHRVRTRPATRPGTAYFSGHLGAACVPRRRWLGCLLATAMDAVTTVGRNLGGAREQESRPHAEILVQSNGIPPVHRIGASRNGSTSGLNSIIKKFNHRRQLANFGNNSTKILTTGVATGPPHHPTRQIPQSPLSRELVKVARRIGGCPAKVSWRARPEARRTPRGTARSRSPRRTGGSLRYGSASRSLDADGSPGRAAVPRRRSGRCPFP